MITLTEWLKKLDAEKVLLAEIDPAGTPVYIADTSYKTEPGDAPSSQPYAPVIVSGGIPRLTRRIQEVWGGRSMASWGPLELTTQFIDGNDLATMNLRGKELNVLLTGPRLYVERSDAVTVLSGRIGPRSGNADGGLTIEIQDEQSRWDDIELPANQYDGTESASFPVANIGLSKPLALGKCRNVPAVLIDQSNWTYQVHDGSIDTMQSIDAVYDNGVSVAFTPDLNAGTFVLSASPVGVITADIQGIKEGANYHSTTTSIIDWLARIYGGLSAPSIDIDGLPAGTVGIYINSSTRLSDVITRLMTGVLGWWGFDRLGVMKARLFNAPSTGGEVVYGETIHLSDLTWEEEDDIIWSVPLRYRRNWMRIEPTATVNADTAAWMRSGGLLSRIEDAAIQASYPSATTANTVETYFDDQVDADAVGTRALALFGSMRRRGSVTIPVSDPMPELGNEATLDDADVMNSHHVIVALTDIMDGEIPKIDMEVWG